MIKTVAIFGVGLIGGSLASALRRSDYCDSVIGIDADSSTISAALDLQIIDQGFTSIDDCPQVPDVVVIAVPVLKVKCIMQQLQPWVSECQVFTDVSSTKQSVVDNIMEVFPGQLANKFVPGHPIAGREKSGVHAAEADLFVNRKVILTPLEGNHKDSVELVKHMWEAAGAQVEMMTAHIHDQILAATSHLPHALAFALVNCLSGQTHIEEIFKYAAGGFADFSRIASSDPIVWRDICLANKHELLHAISQFEGSLKQLSDSLESEDGASLERFFLSAKTARDKFIS